MRWLGLVLAALGMSAAASGAQADPPSSAGVSITYRLPATGKLPKTYRVTLAITDAKNPDWIVSTFLAGAVRTVTAENGGRFTDTWNGLDDNFMPVPPGSYGVKGIYMPARKWALTGEYHTYIPKFLTAVGDSWAPTRDQDGKQLWMWGAAFGTMADIAVGPGGKAVFYHAYFEGSGNPLIIDLNKPVGYDQVLRSFPPGGVGGGPAIATDGEVIWGVSDEDSPAFIFRADRKPFGRGRSHYLSDVYVPAGVVTSLAAWDVPGAHHRFLYAAQSQRDEGVLVLDGDSGADLARLPLDGIRAVAVAGDELYALRHAAKGPSAILRVPLGDGVPRLPWQPVMTLHGIADPTDFKIGRNGSAYVSDLRANQVYKLDRAGRIVLTYGRATQQVPGQYDHHVFMSPGKLALWTDGGGQERLLVVERSGPSRVSEWSSGGKLLREWFAGQTQAVFGYAIDPDDPEHIYMATSEPASGSGLVRFRVDYATGRWGVDGVWPGVSGWGRFPGGTAFPRIIHDAGRTYLAFSRAREAADRFGFTIYRLQGGRWIPSAGLLPAPGTTNPPKPGAAFWWHDANGDGRIEDSEFRSSPADLPAQPRYWGEAWLDDLSLVLIEGGGRSLWRIAPRGFDAHGNPVYDGATWQKLLTDPIFAARGQGGIDALHGGDEIADRFNGDWSSVAGDLAHGIFVDGYNGPSWPDGIDSTGRRASDVKISDYAPDGHGGLRLKWRVGRKAFALAQPGEMYGTMHITPPINHLLCVQDGNGVDHIFTDDGLYVDTLLYDEYRGRFDGGGVYNVGGELWNGYAFLNRENGKVYLASGRNSASLYEVEGWTSTSNGVTRLTTLPQSISIRAEQMAAAPDFALRARGGAGTAKVARFYPATGGAPALDGSMAGWEASEPARFALDQERSVSVRTLYDPDTLYLRWHMRTAEAVAARPVASLDRLFVDNLGLDTLSFYIEGDIAATPSIGGAPRPGDARLVFALIEDRGQVKPVVVGYYPFAGERAGAHPLSFATTVGRADFADVRPLEHARLGYALDADGKGFVIAAAIDRTALPKLPPISTVSHTMVDFAATFGGKANIWWADSDGSASTVTSDEPSEARLYPGAWAQAQFVPVGNSLPVRSWLILGPWGGAPLKTIGAGNISGLLSYFATAAYPPDTAPLDWHATYTGQETLDPLGLAHPLTWHVATAQTDDALLHLGPAGRLYYAASWIEAPEDMDVEFSFRANPENVMAVRVDGQPVRSQMLGQPPRFNVPVEHQSVRLHRGWNLIFVRAYAAGYDLRFGVSLGGTPENLWRIRTSAAPER